MMHDRHKINLELIKTQAVLEDLRRFPTLTKLLEEQPRVTMIERPRLKSKLVVIVLSMVLVLVLAAIVTSVQKVFIVLGLALGPVVFLTLWFLEFRSWHRENARAIAEMQSSPLQTDVFDCVEVRSLIESLGTLELEEIDPIDLEWAAINYSAWWTLSSKTWSSTMPS